MSEAVNNNFSHFRQKVVCATLILLCLSAPAFADEISKVEAIQRLLYFYPNTDFKKTALDYLAVLDVESYRALNNSFGGENADLMKLVSKMFNSDAQFRDGAIAFYRAAAEYQNLRVRAYAQAHSLETEDQCRDDG